MNAHSEGKTAATMLTREEAADLLERYPHVSDSEAKRILTFLRKGRHLDVGMLAGDESMKPHIDRFTADHAKHLRVSPGEVTGLLAGILALLAICWFIWETIKPAAVAA